MDESPWPQTPAELLVILAAIADGDPCADTGAAFSRPVHKSVDYVGDVDLFACEFEAYVAVIRYACTRLKLPVNLKLSVHFGSDKFRIYGPIRTVLQKTGVGLHLETADTTWLEEIIGLAEGGGEGLAIAKDVYRIAMGRFDELCGPYAGVIDIDRNALPSLTEVVRWDGAGFAAAVRHDPDCSAYNPNLRQLLHVGYKVAAEMGSRFLYALENDRSSVAKNVETNLLERHVMRVLPS